MGLRPPQTNATEPQNFAPYEHQEYPKALTHPEASHKQDQVIVKNADEEEEVLSVWDDQFGKDGKHRQKADEDAPRLPLDDEDELPIADVVNALEEAGVKVGKKWTDEDIRSKYTQLLEQS